MHGDDVRPSAAFRSGAAAMLPILLGVIPFGLVAGVVATEVGLRLVESQGFSVLVFAGAAQLAAMDLLGDGAPVAVAAGTALVINLRMLMYSAALAPYVAGLSLRRRLVVAYLLTDQAFAISSVRFRAPHHPAQRWPYYLGGATVLWATWQSSTAAGVLVGDAVPASIPLAFAVPLSFLALLVPTVTDRPTVAAAVAAAAVAVLAAPLPANLGMFVAALTGVTVGVAVTRGGTA